MKNLTIVYITCRREPEAWWFMESLWQQAKEEINIIFIRLNSLDKFSPAGQLDSLKFQTVQPKPTVWQGPHRLTKADWWATSNARNTGICLCRTDWIAFVDDRSILCPYWMEAVRDAMKGPYAVCGPYEKRTAMTVESGFPKNAGIITGSDNRLSYVEQHWRGKQTNPYDCPGAWWYGCSTALPLEWALDVNGYDEQCDGLSGEDYIFGTMLENNNYPIKYDTRLAIIEDRTPGKLEPVMIRRDKGKSPNDKSHALLDLLVGCKRAQHQWNLRQLRTLVLDGQPWPVPILPDKDWYDGQPLAEMDGA
jgi:hypothetical protein